RRWKRITWGLKSRIFSWSATAWTSRSVIAICPLSECCTRMFIKWLARKLILGWPKKINRSGAEPMPDSKKVGNKSADSQVRVESKRGLADTAVGTSILVTVCFYSYFKDLTGCAQTAETVPNAATLDDLFKQLTARFPKLSAMQKSTLIAVG